MHNSHRVPRVSSSLILALVQSAEAVRKKEKTMTVLQALANNYNYYPRTMIRFCSISYDDMGSIPGEVQQLGWEVVWGPAELVSWLDISYSLAYICRRKQPFATAEYTVVIRG